jgi:hypothetical protein
LLLEIKISLMEVARGVGDEGILGIVDKQLEVKNQVRVIGSNKEKKGPNYVKSSILYR